MKKGPSSLLILFSVVVLDLIGFGIVVPILPFYAEKYGANATILGLLLMSYAMMQFIFAPVWGRLSDRIGRKKVLLMTMAGSVVGLLVLGLANSLLLLFAGRILSGAFGANISVASAYVTDVTTAENRAKGMGMIGAAFGIGFILGPALGGALSIYGYHVPILCAAGLSALNVVYASFRLGESEAHHSERKRVSIAEVLRIPVVQKLCAINFLFTLGVNQLESIFAFFMADRFHYDARHVAYILVMMALIMVAIQGGMIKRLVMRFGEKRLLTVGSIFLAFAFFFVPESHSIAFLLIPLAISSVGRGISQPSLMSLVSRGGDESLHGSVMGTFQASASLARVIGPVVAGLLYDRNPAFPFLFACGVLAAVFLLSLNIPVQDAKQRSHEAQPAEAL